MAKETVKIKLTGNSSKPWEVLRRSPEGDYHRQGSKYTIKGLINYLINAAEEFIFESPETREVYEDNISLYEKTQELKRKRWEKEQEEKIERAKRDSQLELTLNAQNLQADTLIEDIVSDHEEKR